jgi:hypothetical protein
MQAIHTRYLGPTDKRGSRVKATTESGRSVTLPWADELSTDENHKLAARTLAQRMEWIRPHAAAGDWYMASAHGGGCVFVRADEHEKAF